MAPIQPLVNGLCFVQGCHVQVYVTNGKIYEGILGTISPDVSTKITVWVFDVLSFLARDIQFQCDFSCQKHSDRAVAATIAHQSDNDSTCSRYLSDTV